VTWTGTTPLFPVISVCQMSWLNPKPEVPVKAVRFANPPRNMCPVLIALTAAVKPGKADIEAMAAGQVQAKQWLNKGVAAVNAGADAEARRAFQEALKADGRLDAAYQSLCELEERSHDENAILAAYKAWAASGARTPLPYNKIGQILERRGDPKRALEAYTTSLEIQWNQPPIIEAKSRLTQQMGK
jgi:Tfp pilus assembly protein PilF